MSLTISSSTSTASLVSNDAGSSGKDDVAAIKARLASAQTALSEAEEAGDTEEATTQQALVTKYTAELATAQKASESSGSAAVQASSPATAETEESAEANPYKPTARIDVTTLAASDAAGVDGPAGTSEAGASARAEADRAEAEYKANMPLAAETAETAEA